VKIELNPLKWFDRHLVPVVTPAVVGSLQQSKPVKAVEDVMGFFSKIASALHTFGAWAEKEWTVIYSSAPTIEQVAAAVLKYAGPALSTVVTAEAGGPAGALVAKALSDAQAGLLAASSLIYDFGAHPSVVGSIKAVQTNLSALLSAGHITNATSVATVTKVVNELDSLSQAIPLANAAAAVAVA
jgi:hypothetical protein